MDEKYLILSDLHGNMSAFNAVLADCEGEDFAGVILLGDLIDYGMRSNELLAKIRELSEGEWKGKILSNLWGNHEKLAIDRDLERLSSERGRGIANYTREHLSDESIAYIENVMTREAKTEFTIGGLKALAVHGSLFDPYWKAILPEDVRGEYVDYDLVFSGHSHYSQSFIQFYPIEDPALRNKKAVLFINPGSVGQPRNQNPNAQYAVLTLPSKKVELRAVPYDIVYEQSLYPDEIDVFYKERLTLGV